MSRYSTPARRGLLIASGILVLLAGFFIVRSVQRSPFVEIHVTDAISNSWIHGVEVRLGSRFNRGFFQTRFSFGPLDYGTHEVAINALGYEPSEPLLVQVSRQNPLTSVSITLNGVGIPDLTDLLVFEALTDDGIEVELRPVDSQGRGIIRHPTMPIAIGTVVYEQHLNGVPVRFPTSEGAERGRELYRGVLDWRWNTQTDSGYRYHALISADELVDTPVQFAVIDYVILVSDTTNITSEALSEILMSTEIDALTPPDSVATFYDTSWNVRLR